MIAVRFLLVVLSIRQSLGRPHSRRGISTATRFLQIKVFVAEDFAEPL
jgi:hypothetical protein